MTTIRSPSPCPNSRACSVAYLCDRELQLDHVLRLGHGSLQSRVQEQNSVQVLPASHCVIVHKQDLIHRREVLTPHTASGLRCGGSAHRERENQQLRLSVINYCLRGLLLEVPSLSLIQFQKLTRTKRKKEIKTPPKPPWVRSERIE